MNHVPRWSLALLACVALAVVTTGALGLDLGGEALGYPGGDQMDLARLRLAVARAPFAGHSADILPPTGYPLGALLPNRLDHWTGAPLALLLPWPLADNLWWWLVLTADAAGAWWLGRRIGGTHAAGALTAVALVWSEPLLREANQAHGPQVMIPFSPLFVAALAGVLGGGGRRDAVLLGVAAGLSGLTWWYQPILLAFGAAPVAAVALARDPARRARLVDLAIALGVALLIVAPALPSTLQGFGAGTSGADLPWNRGDVALRAIPEAHRWTFGQGGDVLWWLGSGVSDRANRVSLVLVAAAIAGVRAGGQRRWALGALVGAILLMGPFLKVGTNPILVGRSPIPLPGWALSELSGTMARLHWPQRWGILVPLFLLPLAARAPRPGRWTVALGLEALLFSRHLPLSTTPVGQLDGWRALANASGAILAIPVDPHGNAEAWGGFKYRAATRPLITTFRTPRWAPWPKDWLEWRATDPVERWLGDPAHAGPIPREELDRLRRDGVSAIVLDVTPGGPLRPGESADALNDLAPALTTLGPPEDFGSVIVWWLETGVARPAPVADGERWRADWLGRLAERQRGYSPDVGLTWMLPEGPKPPPRGPVLPPR